MGDFLAGPILGIGRWGTRERVARLPVKQSGLDLPYPTLTALEKWTASHVITGHLVGALRGQVEFRAADHSDRLQEGRSAQRAEEALATTITWDPVQGARRLGWATKTGAWLTVQPSTVNRT